MGLIERVLQVVFGNGRNVVKDTVEVFRENADAAAARDAEVRAKTLNQFGAEFVVVERGWFDRLMDASTGCRARRWHLARWGCSLRRWSIRSGLPRVCRELRWYRSRYGGCWGRS